MCRDRAILSRDTGIGGQWLAVWGWLTNKRRADAGVEQEVPNSMAGWTGHMSVSFALCLCLFHTVLQGLHFLLKVFSKFFLQFGFE